MTIHQCPKCELRFEYKTELDDHCRQDHPAFRHEYPAQAIPEPLPEAMGHPSEPDAGAPVKRVVEGFFGWLRPSRGENSAAGRATR